MILYGWTKAVLLMELDFLDAKLMVKIIGFPNGPSFRYGNFFIPRVEKTSKNQPTGRKAFLPRAVGPREVSFSFPRANFKVFFNPRDEEISIPETHGPFGNCMPVGVNQATFLFHASIKRVFSKKKQCAHQKIVKF